MGKEGEAHLRPDFVQIKSRCCQKQKRKINMDKRSQRKGLHGVLGLGTIRTSQPRWVCERRTPSRDF